MNAMPSPPPSDPNAWFSIAEHLEALLGFLAGGLATAGLAVWRMAVWTTSVKAEMEKVREASEARQKAILDTLEEIQKTSHERYEATQREMDQIHSVALSDREETREHRREARETAAALSARIDNALARGG